MVDGAAHALGGAEDLPHHSGEVLGVGPRSHDSIMGGDVNTRLLPRRCRLHDISRIGPNTVPGGVEDIINLDVAIVLDVLHLLTISVGLLESLDDDGGCRGTHSNLSERKHGEECRYIQRCCHT